MNRNAIDSLSPAGPHRCVVLVSSRYDDRYLVEHASRMVQGQHGGFLALWIDTGRVRDTAAMAQLERTFALAQHLGGETLVLQGPSAMAVLTDYLAVHQPTTVLLGSPVGRHWPWRRPLSQQLLKSQLPLEISVLSRPETTPFPHSASLSNSRLHQGYLVAAAAIMAAAAIAVALHNVLESGSLVVLYVFTVALVGLNYGTRPAMFSAVLAYLAFNFLHTAPLYSLSVHKSTDVRTLVFLAVTSLICGPIASRARQQFELLKTANRAAEMQRDFISELSRLDDEQALWQFCQQRFQHLLQRPVSVITRLHPSSDVSWFGEAPRQSDDGSKMLSEPAFRITDLEQRLSPLWSQHQPMPFQQLWVQPITWQQQTQALVLVPLQFQSQPLRPEQREQLRQLSQQLEQVLARIKLSANAEANRVKAEMEQLRSALLASVSHDLRSPLAAMMGSAESLLLLQDKLTVDDQQELLKTILSESQRLDRYIQNLLDMTRLGHGGLKLERDWVPLSDILGSVLSRVRKYFPSLSIEVMTLPHSPMLYVHGALIEQALFNILENAARYSPSDGLVSVELLQDDSQVQIAIEDDGPGISPDKREQVFDMFYVVAEGDHKRHNTGMGLAICRGMINAHGGQVRLVDPTRHHGARFQISLPLPDKLPAQQGAV